MDRLRTIAATVAASVLVVALPTVAAADAARPRADGGAFAYADTGGSAPATVAADPSGAATPGDVALPDPVTALGAVGVDPGATSVVPALPVVRTDTVAGTVAKLRTDGKAAIPRAAPKRVRTLIAAYNKIVGSRYKWGGGHARVIDTGYDCSGAVSYGMIALGLLDGPLVSGDLAHYGAAGPGRWITIYANGGHVYTEVAGLRLDTSPAGDPGGLLGVRWRPLIGARPRFHVRHPVGL